MSKFKNVDIDQSSASISNNSTGVDFAGAVIENLNVSAPIQIIVNQENKDGYIDYEILVNLKIKETLPKNHYQLREDLIINRYDELEHHLSELQSYGILNKKLNLSVTTNTLIKKQKSLLTKTGLEKIRLSKEIATLEEKCKIIKLFFELFYKNIIDLDKLCNICSFGNVEQKI